MAQYRLERAGGEWVAVAQPPGAAEPQRHVLQQHSVDVLLVSEGGRTWELQREDDGTAGRPPPVSYHNSLDDQGGHPGPVHWALATILSVLLIAGLIRVHHVLQGLDVVSTALRNVPEGMRPAECGQCHTTQYIGSHGRIFICFSCHSANRTPRDAPTGELQVLITPTGPLRSYEFRKGGENYWQELSQAELPAPEQDAEANTEAQKLHYRGTFCLACQQQPCRRLAEFPGEAVVAYLPEVPATDVRANAAPDDTIVRPVVLGRETESAANDDVVSNRSTRTNDNGLPQCVVCLDKLGCMVLLPCAHGSVCEDCATRIAQNRAIGGAHCPHCRAGIETLVKIHEVDGDLAKGIEIRIPMARPA